MKPYFRVQCIDAEYSGGLLEQGEIYTVSRIIHNGEPYAFYELWEEPTGMYSTERFIKIGEWMFQDEQDEEEEE